MQTVHPHIRGAYPAREFCSILRPGSSPHTWGIPEPHKFQAQRVRFIPTYVGHTPGPTRSPVSHTVHPHIRGAYWYTSASFSASTGSSPHTWGIPVGGRSAQSAARFIPTYVGHTKRKGLYEADGTVHPHIRGAYSMILTISASISGSSPHTWGIRAGGTIPRPSGGSSPHTWGIHSIWQIAAGPIWFIPTYVGHTFLPALHFPGSAVHPHIRGAYTSSERNDPATRGSSPHTWGIPGWGNYPPAQRRFIPTYVGHTRPFVAGSRPRPVHPHIRGAYTGPP